MRIGSTFGPYLGLYWVNVEARTVTIRQDGRGISAEITLPLTRDEMDGLLDGLMEPPVDRRRGEGGGRKTRRKALLLKAVGT